MPWTRRPSTCACRCFPGRRFQHQGRDKTAYAPRLARRYPAFIIISDGRLHNVNVLDLLLPEPGAFYVMDRAYLDFERLYALDQAGAFFVTRAESNSSAGASTPPQWIAARDSSAISKSN